MCAGRDFTCGVLELGGLDCWKRQDAEHSTADGDFVEVACGERLVCARSADGEVSCWEGERPVAAPDPVTHLSVGALPCGVLDDGALTCAADDSSGIISVDLPAGSDFAAVAAGTVQACGLRTSGVIACGEVG